MHDDATNDVHPFIIKFDRCEVGRPRKRSRFHFRCPSAAEFVIIRFLPRRFFSAAAVTAFSNRQRNSIYHRLSLYHYTCTHIPWAGWTLGPSSSFSHSLQFYSMRLSTKTSHLSVCRSVLFLNGNARILLNGFAPVREKEKRIVGEKERKITSFSFKKLTSIFLNERREAEQRLFDGWVNRSIVAVSA